MQVIGFDTVIFERVRASLRGGPFHFTRAERPCAGDALPDLYVTHASDAAALAGPGVPVIACGPSSSLRSSFLAGCADFLREPWLPEELEMRALAVLSRARRSFDFSWGTVSFEGKDLRTPGGLVSLTHHESSILRLLLRARGEPVPRAAIAYELWGNLAHAAGRAVDMHVASVRRKVRLARNEAGRFIVCVRNRGYMVP